MNLLKKTISSFLIVLIVFTITISISFIIVGKTTKNEKVISNINLEKTISEEVMEENYNAIYKERLKPVFYDSVEEAALNAKNFPTSFRGYLTHYGPDCKLCGGTLGCNGQKATNGNIYYNDKEYGTIRIVAATTDLPCGTILRINVDAYDKNGMYAIVLDRGVSGRVIDLLKTSQKTKSPVGTVNNTIFDIVRYGY